MGSKIYFSYRCFNFALGTILSQEDDEKNERVIAYASRLLLPAEKNYTATELECLAIMWAIEKFHQYVYGYQFLLIMDHSALCHLLILQLQMDDWPDGS